MAALLVVSACAPKEVRLPAPGPAHFPDYLYPSVPPALSVPAAVAHHDRGWQLLQAGDLTRAGREFSAALRESASFYPAQVGLGDVALAQRDATGALGWFARALAQNPRYVPALVGRAQAQVALKQDEAALQSLQEALAIDPSLGDVRRQVAVLQFHAQRDAIDAARKAAAAGRLAEAEQAYADAIRLSPDSAFLYRELAEVERRAGRPAAALQDLRKAVALAPSDGRAYGELGALLDQQGDLDGAAQAYRQAYAIAPDAALQRRLQDVENRLALAKLPDAYRQIAGSPQITRAELAALIGVRLDALVRSMPASGAVLVTDASGSWASRWILEVIRAGIMEPYPNHTFQPHALVSRGDLAAVLSRMLTVLAARDPALGRAWRGQHLVIRDVPRQHLMYPAVSLVIAAGVLPLLPDGTFQLRRAVSGADAIAAIDRVSALAGAQGARGGADRGAAEGGRAARRSAGHGR